MELKYEMKISYSAEYISSNRTFMELKLVKLISTVAF